MKRLFKVFCLILVFALVSTTILAAKEDKKVTITFWNGFTGSDGEILKEIVKDFNQKQHGAIEIKMDIMPRAVLFQKLPPAIATKTAPSFILMDPVDVPQYVANGSLKSLNNFWATTGLKEKDYLPNVLKLMKYHEKYYLLPMQTNLIYLYWNKDLFKTAGLDPERPPQSLTELGNYAIKLTNSEKSQFGLGLPVKGAPVFWTSFIWNNGGEFIDLKKKKSLFNSPANIQTLEWLQDLAVNQKVSPKGATGSDLDNLMFSGKLGMYINGPWLVNGLKNNHINFGIAAPPKGTARQQVVAGGMGFAIPSCTRPDEVKAVYKFIKYWMSPEILKEWSLKNGFPAWSYAVMNDPEIKADPVQSVITPLGTLGRGYTLGLKNAPAIDNDAIWPMIEALLAGAEKPSDAAKKTSAKIDSILKMED